MMERVSLFFVLDLVKERQKDAGGIFRRISGKETKKRNTVNDNLITEYIKFNNTAILY